MFNNTGILYLLFVLRANGLWKSPSVMRCYIYLLLNVFNTVLSSDVYANILQWRVYKVLQNNSNTICFTVVNISTSYVHYVFVRPYTKFNIRILPPRKQYIPRYIDINLEICLLIDKWTTQPQQRMFTV